MQHIVKAMRDQGWNVRTVRLECFSIDEQFQVMANTTTLIGYHGTGLAWNRMLPLHAASIQVHGLPCVSDINGLTSKMFKTRRGPYTVLHSALSVIGVEENQTRANMRCRKGEISKMGDIRKMDAFTDIPRLMC